jgi:hypothetical protein
MLKWIVCALSATVVFSRVPELGQAAQGSYVPGIKIVLEVRTPQGELRSFQRPGFPPTYWLQDLPVVRGDKVTIDPMIATGGAELGSVKIRLDHADLTTRTESPWRIEVDSASLVPGYHLIEVWAKTKPPGSKEKSATTTFLVVPQNDSLLRLLQPGADQTEPPVSQEERLACTIRARGPKVDQDLTATSAATVAGPTLFFVSAGPAVKEFFYTLSRDGRVTYTSPRLPLITSILLEPLTPEGQGLAAGTLILTARAGDGEGRFGAPAWITVNVKPAEAAK